MCGYTKTYREARIEVVLKHRHYRIKAVAPGGHQKNVGRSRAFGKDAAAAWKHALELAGVKLDE